MAKKTAAFAVLLLFGAPAGGLSSDLQEGAAGDLPLCESLADDFCQTLWSSENQGNIRFADGTGLLYGARRADFISSARFIHLQKLAESRCRLPEDIKRALGIAAGAPCEADGGERDLLSDLSLLLSQIDSARPGSGIVNPWAKSIDEIRWDFNHIISDAAYDRILGENPDIQDKFWKGYSAAEKKSFKSAYYDIKTEIMDAVYLSDPRWLAAVRLFEEAKADILAVLERMALDPDTKNIMRERINDVKISLPYEDPRKARSPPSCAEDDNNGYYNSLQNKVFLCMGKVNASHNEGALYGTIAHEIAHSIGPGVFLDGVFRQSPLVRLLGRIYESGGSLPCEKWEERKSAVFQPPSEIHQLPPGLSALDQCLADRSGLNDMTLEALDWAGQRQAEASMDNYARFYAFSYLTEPEILKNGALTENEAYLDPKLYEAERNEYFDSIYFLAGYFHPASVFVQEYKCGLERPEMTEARAFAEALEETKRLNALYEYNFHSRLGVNSSWLAGFNLSRPSDEAFADWAAAKAAELKLQRMKSLQSRRDFVFSGMAVHCSPDRIESIAKDKAIIERKYSRSFYSPARARQLRGFTPQTAELLQCARGEDIEKIDSKSCDFLLQ